METIDKIAIPSYLLEGDNAVDLYPYSEHGGGMCPDYKNDRLIHAMESLIKEMV